MKNPAPLIVLLAFAAMTACRKDKDRGRVINASATPDSFILAGQITDTPARKGLSGVELRFFFTEYPYQRMEIPGTVTTDSKGHYRFAFPAGAYLGRQGYFSMEFTKQGYMQGHPPVSTLEPPIFLDSSNINRPAVKNYALYSITGLDVRLLSSSTGIISIDFEHNFGGGSIGRSYHDPGPIDIPFRIITAANVPTVLHVVANIKGKILHKRDTVVVKDGLNLVYEMKF